MRLNKIIQRDYTSFSLYYQIKLPLDLEISIPSDDLVRLVSAFVEEMDLSELYKTYGRIRKNQATPRQMLKLVIYAAMNRIYSSRDIRKACKRDINFMYLLEGMPAPDHATIARFISLHFSACAKVLLAQMSDLLYLLGEISGKTIFIDGTKIESAANKYTFVWKRAITKNQARLYTKLTSFVAECEELYGIRTVYHDQISIHTLKRLKKQLCRVKVQEGIVFVHGIGRRKTQLQKSLEQLDQYLEKRKEYTKKLYTLGDRNSYSKTDPDATFMIKDSLSPVFSGALSPLVAANCYEFDENKNLFLLPGHIEFSEYDATYNIAENLTGSLIMFKNVPGALRNLLQMTAEKYGFDYILVDMSPNISATNANILMESDFFIVPCAPDYFCYMAIDSLTKVFPRWDRVYSQIKENDVFKSADYKMNSGKPQFIGTIQQRYRPRNGSPAKAFSEWIDDINMLVQNKLVPALKKCNMIVPYDSCNYDETYNLINIADFNSLIA